MLHIFQSPDTEHQNDLSILNQFKRWVNDSNLPPTTQQHAIKVLESFRFIKVNLNALQEFVDNKARYLPLLPEPDQINQCIRDHLDSSMHFNSYTSGAQAAANLAELVANFENIFTEWGAADETLALNCLVAKFNWDEEKGCLEARVAEPMSIAARYKSSGMLSVEELLQLAQSLYFIGFHGYNFVMLDEFCADFYNKQLLMDGLPQSLTRELIFGYMVHLGYDLPTDQEFESERSEKQSNPAAWFSKAFDYLIKNAEPVVLGQTGMYQYRFKTREPAEDLSLWLRRCPLLQAVNIRKCKVSDEAGRFVVRLTAE